MLTAEHTQTAREFFRRAPLEFNNGNPLIGSELLWGAAAHAILAIATERGWHKDSHGAIRAAARMLSGELNDRRLLSDFDSAEKLHANFYHNNLSPDALAQRRRRTELLIPRLLAVLG